MFDKIKQAYLFLQGKKTYIMAAGGVVTEVASILGFITPEQRMSLLGIFGAGAVASMGAKVNRLIGLLKDTKAI